MGKYVDKISILENEIIGLIDGLDYREFMAAKAIAEQKIRLDDLREQLENIKKLVDDQSSSLM